MRIGAKITLNAGPDAARDGLARLADAAWLMSLPLRQQAHHGHPAGRARPGLALPGIGTGLVAVTFGSLPTAHDTAGALPVHWESVELDNTLALLLAGEVTLTSDTQGTSTLALAGFCRLLSAADGDYALARLDAVKEVARSFITSVAVAVGPPAGLGQQSPPVGPAWAWLTGQ